MKRTAAALMVGVALAGAASAGEVLVTSNISTSTTWTRNNTYNLQNQIYVLPGASLTIEAGTIIASHNTNTGLGGSIAVCKGAKLFALGTKRKPIIFTSKADKATWTDSDPGTGIWREASNEWGNITMMGKALISENAIAGNVATCSASNVADMEGLTNGPTTDRYGGGNDDDDSGTIEFVSLRYGGKIVGLGNELNGLSLGGIGRDTDIHHLDIMNNVDDGIEIWGGTVNIKYFNIWNIGDDCFDVDQGWRGKAQFGLLVQGYSTRVAQGSGTGDNIFELDGAESADYQPVTTATIYNCTAIGQPGSASGTALDGGDHATAWRDGARVQFRNSIFMDIGDRVVSPDGTDGDSGSGGYGVNSTLSFAATWTTPYNAVPAHANDCSSPATVYQAQSSGFLSEISDCIFFRNLTASAYTESDARGVTTPGGLVTFHNVKATNMPIQKLVRATGINYSGLHQEQVIELDPRPANDALTSFAAAPNDGFFTPASYRGAFAPPTNGVEEMPWISGWTAADAFGFVVPHKVRANN